MQDKKITLEFLRRLCYSFAGGTVRNGLPVRPDGRTIDGSLPGYQLRYDVQCVCDILLGKHAAKKVVMELIRPVSEYATDPACSAKTDPDDVRDYMGLVWTRLHKAFISHDRHAAQVAWKTQAFDEWAAMAESLTNLVDAAADSGNSYETILCAILFE